MKKEMRTLIISFLSKDGDIYLVPLPRKLHKQFAETTIYFQSHFASLPVFQLDLDQHCLHQFDMDLQPTLVFSILRDL